MEVEPCSLRDLGVIGTWRPQRLSSRPSACGRLELVVSELDPQGRHLSDTVDHPAGTLACWPAINRTRTQLPTVIRLVAMRLSQLVNGVPRLQSRSWVPDPLHRPPVGCLALRACDQAVFRPAVPPDGFNYDRFPSPKI